jgi:WD40 repeat protein
MNGELRQAIVRILKRSGDTAGTGFVIAETGLIATCAHVIEGGGWSRGELVNVVFHATNDKRSAHVECWRDSGQQDVAILRLDSDLPEVVVPVLLGSSSGTDDHPIKTFGFPEDKEVEGMPGGGEVVGSTTEAGYEVLGLRSHEITAGFSGAPVLDMSTQRVIGMVTSISRPDEFGRMGQSAFVTPTETLREICPALQLSDVCPYRGLHAFGETDSSFFFGRDALVQRLLDKLKQEPSFLAVLGPSGSGKSSLVQAGLIPNLKQGKLSGSQRWGVKLIRPFSDPFEELSKAGFPLPNEELKIRTAQWLKQHPNNDRIVLAIDQFEEVFTGCSQRLCGTFLQQLTDLLDSGEPVTVILTMRDEFYAHFTQEAPALVSWIERGTANVPSSLTQAELIDIVEKPATAVGLRFEAHLVETIVKDAMELDHDGAGRIGRSTVLPLLEFALTQLWELRLEGVFCHDPYRNRVSGVTGALTNWADREFRRIEQSQRPLALRVLTDLVYLGDESKGIPDTRRRRPASELWRNENERQQVQDIVQPFIAARLLVTGGDSIELIHDALLREWGLLGSRLRQDRIFLRWRQEIESRVEGWVKTAPADIRKRDVGKLLGGGDLIEAERWMPTRGDDLSEAEHGFVEESLRQREAQNKRDAEQKRELEQALARAERQLAVSESQRLAFAARAVSMARPETALLLACEAVKRDHSPLTEELLRDALDNVPWQVTAFEAHSKGVNSALFSDDAESILTASDDGTARLWDLRGECLVRFSGHTESVTSAVFSPDNRTILTTSEDGTARLWDLGGRCSATLKYPTERGYHSYLTRGAFSPDGSLILVCDYDEAWLWQINGTPVPTIWDARQKLSAYYDARRRDPSTPLEESDRIWDEGHVDRIFSAAFSPDGERVVTASKDGTARIWNISNHSQTILKGHESMVINAIFSPIDGKMVLTGSMDNTARLWTVDGELIAILSGHAADVGHLAFSPDRGLILTAVHGGGTQDPVVRLWDSSGNPVMAIETGHIDWIRDVAFSPDGKKILTASSDGTARLFNVHGATLGIFKGHLDRVESVAFNRNGKLMVTGSHDGTARLWEDAESLLPTIKNHSKPVTNAIYGSHGSYIFTSSLDGTTCLSDQDGQCLATYSGRSDLDDNVLSPDERHLLTVEEETGHVKLWELPVLRQAPKRKVEFSDVHLAKAQEPAPLAILAFGGDTSSGFHNRKAVFSSTGKRILTAGGTAELWDREGQLINMLRGPNLNSREWLTVDFGMFSPDGQHILTGSINGSVWVWNADGDLIGSFLADGGSAGDNLFSLAFSPDGGRILTTVRQQASLWDLAGSLQVELRCNTNKVKRGLFSPLGDRILTVAEAAIPDVRLWDSEGELIARLSATGGEWAPIAFDSDGKRLCVVDGNVIKIWDHAGDPITSLVAERGTWIKGVSFSPDGEHLLAASSAGVAQLWSIAAGSLQKTFKGHTAEVNSAAFSRDGRKILTASSDGTARQFVLKLDELIASAARRTARCLDSQEIAEFNVRTPLLFDPKQVVAVHPLLPARRVS